MPICPCQSVSSWLAPYSNKTTFSTLIGNISSDTQSLCAEDDHQQTSSLSEELIFALEVDEKLIIMHRFNKWTFNEVLHQTHNELNAFKYIVKRNKTTETVLSAKYFARNEQSKYSKPGWISWFCSKSCYRSKSSLLWLWLRKLCHRFSE